MATIVLVPQDAATRRRDRIALVARIFDYLFGLLYALLAVRLILELIGARGNAGFVEFIRAVTSVFYAPFKGIVPSETIDGTHPIVWPIIIAIVAYMLLHAAIRGLLRLVSRSTP